jgi:hypothetical protein
MTLRVTAIIRIPAATATRTIGKCLFIFAALTIAIQRAQGLIRSQARPHPWWDEAEP